MNVDEAKVVRGVEGVLDVVRDGWKADAADATGEAARVRQDFVVAERRGAGGCLGRDGHRTAAERYITVDGQEVVARAGGNQVEGKRGIGVGAQAADSERPHRSRGSGIDRVGCGTGDHHSAERAAAAERAAIQDHISGAGSGAGSVVDEECAGRHGGVAVVGVAGGKDQRTRAALHQAGGSTGIDDRAADGGGSACGGAVDRDRAIGAIQIETILEVERLLRRALIQDQDGGLEEGASPDNRAAIAVKVERARHSTIRAEAADAARDFHLVGSAAEAVGEGAVGVGGGLVAMGVNFEHAAIKGQILEGAEGQRVRNLKHPACDVGQAAIHVAITETIVVSIVRKLEDGIVLQRHIEG